MELPGELEGSMHEATRILKVHKTFLLKQKALVKDLEKVGSLPSTVSSKRCAEAATGSSSEQRRLPSQVDKNRKRKLKKKRSKEKHQKLEQTPSLQ
jgi:hypothetical protein